MTSTTKPLPEITDELRPFFDAAREHRLVVQRCTDCGTTRFPPRPLCNHCLGRRAEWIPSTGRGHVYSYNVMHQVYHPAFRDEVPYAVLLVELEEGCRIVSNLVGCPPDRVWIGMPVEVVFERQNDEITLPKFRPV